VSFRRGMYRPNIKNPFSTGVIETLVGKCGHTKKGQENSKPSNRFHLYSRRELDCEELGRGTQTKR